MSSVGNRFSRLVLILLLLTTTAWFREAQAAQLTLTWVDTSTNEDGFEIERKTNTSGTFAQVTVVGANISSYADTGVTAGTTYCYHVRAYNAAGASPYSNEACGTPATQTVTLTVTTAGSGSGTVTSSPAGISCGATCTASYPSGTSVTLTATPDANSTFTGWSDACSGTTTSCTVTMSAAASATATFTLQIKTRIGVFRPSTGRWYLDINGNGVLDDCPLGCLEPFGQQGNFPVAGNWTGIGTTQIGVFEPSTRLWKLDRNGNDQWDGCQVDLCFGPIWRSTDLPVVGHWTRSATKDMIGIFRPSNGTWRFDYDGDGKWTNCTVDGCEGSFGTSTDLPVVGNWGGTGATEIGFFRPSTGRWKLDFNGNGKADNCTEDKCLGPFGLQGDLPVIGDWTGTGQVKIGLFNPSTGLWDLDLNGNGVFDGCTVDACLGPFGQQGDLPVVGNW